MIKPLISIIIPTYNRAHTIAETLDSVLSQTYTNWECIIIDDGSTDHTDKVVNAYVAKDARFKYYQRPINKPKGANSCRNFGIEKVSGNAVILFDSDDLMVETHIEFKATHLHNGNYDFIVTRTRNLNSNHVCNSNYEPIQKHSITAFNYITQKINWLTLDVIIKRPIIEKIKFNEKLDSGQEFNFFSKLVLLSTNAVFYDKVLSLRRIHDNSIRSSLNNQSKINVSAFNAKWCTYLDIKQFKQNEINRDLIRKCIMRIYLEKKVLTKDKFVFARSVYKELGVMNLMWYLFMITSLSIFGRGFYFANKIN